MQMCIFRLKSAEKIPIIVFCVLTDPKEKQVMGAKIKDIEAKSWGRRLGYGENSADVMPNMKVDSVHRSGKRLSG